MQSPGIASGHIGGKRVLSPLRQHKKIVVIDWWNHKRSENINPNSTEVLYGYKPESNSFHTFNHYLLIARYYVYLARNKFETPELEVFIVLLEIKIQCEREIAIANGNLNKYRNKWTTLCISD